MKPSHSQTQLVIGLVIVAIGALALLDNLDLFNFRSIFHFWPTLFMVFGLVKLSQARSSKQRFWGGLFIVVGILMTLNAMNIMPFHVRDWWPVILIALGIKMLLSEKQSAMLNPAEDVANLETCDTNVDITATLAGAEGKVASQDFRGGRISTLMGGVDLDLRQAAIQDCAVLDLNAIAGGICLKIPREWIIENEVTAILGGLDDKSVPLLGSHKRLKLTGLAFMGGIEIKN